MEFSAGVAGLTLFGYWLDHKFGLTPWGVLIGSAVGLVGGTYNLIRATLPFVRPQEEKRPESEALPDEEKGISR